LALAPLVTALITSPSLRRLRYQRARFARKITGRRPEFLYFHQADDPYGALLVQVLGRFAQQYDVDVRPFLVPPPSAAAAPESDRLHAYAVRDATRLALQHGLKFSATVPQPSTESVRAAQNILAKSLLDRGNFLGVADQVSRDLWHGVALDDGGSPGADAALREGEAQRARLGHYLGGMIYFEGEWYWGLDRLPYLQTRLARETGRKFPAIIEALQAPVLDPLSSRATIQFFASPRSPYTYLAAARVRQLADYHGATLVLRPVLPMVMRGLPVPLAKRIYIVRDTMREAETLGMPFGLIADPVGAPVERGLALLFHAMQIGKGSLFLESFLQAVFSQGIDAGSDRGLHMIARRGGLTDTDVSAALADHHWRAQAEENRQALFDLGLWGVPSFQVNDLPAVWGQDRLWMVEQDLQTAKNELRKSAANDG